MNTYKASHNDSLVAIATWNSTQLQQSAVKLLNVETVSTTNSEEVESNVQNIYTNG